MDAGNGGKNVVLALSLRHLLGKMFVRGGWRRMEVHVDKKKKNLLM